MKVLIVSPMFPPQGWGAEISTMLECKELVENNVKVVLVTNNHVSIKPYQKWTRKLKIYRLPMPFISFIYPRYKPFGEFGYWIFQEGSWEHIYKIAVKEHVDLIHVEHAYIGFREEPNIPIALTIRDYWPICVYRTLFKNTNCCAYKSFIWGFPCRKRIYLEYGLAKLPHLFYNIYFTPLLHLLCRKVHSLVKRKFQKVDRFIAISNFIKDVLSRKLRIAREKIEVIYPPLPEMPYVHRISSPSEVTFTYIGALEAHKGVMNLLRAFHLAVKNNKSIKLLIYGEGALYPRIREYISANRLTDKIEVLGRVSYKDLHRVYERTDVVVVPSLWPEPFGRVSAEALLAGRPVLINPVGGLKEQVIDGLTGFHANCYNIKAFARKIIEISSMPRAILHEMGLKAREHILTNFERRKRIERLIKIYESLR